MNTLRRAYQALARHQKTEYKSMMMRQFGWVNEQTVYRKLLKDYQPTGAEEKVSEMIVKDINSQK